MLNPEIMDDLYTKNQYRQLLDKAGFASTEFYVPVPGYHHPTAMVPAENIDSICAKVRRNTPGWVNQLKQGVKGWIAARFPDAFGIVAASARPRF